MTLPLLVACDGSASSPGDAAMVDGSVLARDAAPSDGMGMAWDALDAAATDGSGDGSASTLRTCDPDPLPTTLRFCVGELGGRIDASTPGPLPSLTISARGTITAVRRGSAQGGCLGQYSGDGSDILALTVREAFDGGARDWDVEYQAPSMGEAWAVGQPLQIDYAYKGSAWARPVSSLRLSRDGAVEAYFGAAGRIEDLAPGPFQFEQGEAVCGGHHMCGDWAVFDFKTQLDGVLISVPYGGMALAPPYRIVHGDFIKLVSRTGCTDFYMDNVAVAVFRDGM